MASPLKDAKLLAEAAERGRLKACAERDALATRVAKLEESLRCAVGYLDGYHQNQISSGSKLHSQMRNALAAQGGRDE